MGNKIMTEKIGKKKLSRREILNRNAFKAGGAAAKLRRVIPIVNDALIQCAQAGIAVKLKIGHIPDSVGPMTVYLEAELTRGKRKEMKTNIIERFGS